jgi:hypothetical protein
MDRDWWVNLEIQAKKKKKCFLYFLDVERLRIQISLDSLTLSLCVALVGLLYVESAQCFNGA